MTKHQEKREEENRHLAHCCVMIGGFLTEVNMILPDYKHMDAVFNQGIITIRGLHDCDQSVKNYEQFNLRFITVKDLVEKLVVMRDIIYAGMEVVDAFEEMTSSEGMTVQ